jgi:hypothetical protein
MSKKILVIYYSQTGQLESIVNSFIEPFVEMGVKIDRVKIKPKNDFQFPWTSARFFDVMPESVLGMPVELEYFEFKEQAYGLIIFAYQPWYLSPSIPAMSVLKQPEFQKILKGSPVVTLIGARNMWVNAQEQVKKILVESGATLVGNVVLTDKNNNHISAVTILYWMLTGKKDRYLNIFPKPGISEVDILESKKHGAVVNSFLQNGNWGELQKKLVGSKAIEVKFDLVFIEERARRLFAIWANIIIKKKNRAPWLVLFKYYLLFALFIIAPIVLTINRIFFKPFLNKKINNKKKYYLGLNS